MFSFFNIDGYFKVVDEDIVKNTTWQSGVYKERILLLLDLENIPYSYFPKIKSSLKFAHECLFVITYIPIKYSNLISIKKDGFEVLVAHKIDSDIKIKKIYKLLKEYNEFVFITSDSDLTDIGKKILSEGKKLTWVMQDANKKHIVMKMNIADENLRFMTLGNLEL